MLDGVLAGVETGFQQARIADAAFEEQRRFDAGELVRVGVTRFVDDDSLPLELLEIPIATETAKVADLAAHRSARDPAAAERGARRARGGRARTRREPDRHR